MSNRRLVFLLPLLLAPTGAAPGGDGAAPDRRFLMGEWEIVGEVPPADDGILLNPMILAAERGRFYVYDYGDHKVKAYTISGKLLWTAGRSGQGPGEFANPTDIAVAADHTVWLADPPNDRITVLDSTGALRATVSQTATTFRVQPLSGGRHWVSRPAEPFVALADTSRRAVQPLPVPGVFSDADRHVQELFLVDLGDEMLGVVYMWSSRFVIVRGARHEVAVFDGVQRQSFPPGMARRIKTAIGTVTRLGPDPKLAPVTRGATRCDGNLVVLAADVVDGRSVIDGYDPGSGEYQGSRQLPAKVAAIDCEWGGAVLVGLISDPSPTLVAWRWRPRKQ